MRMGAPFPWGMVQSSRVLGDIYKCCFWVGCWFQHPLPYQKVQLSSLKVEPEVCNHGILLFFQLAMPCGKTPKVEGAKTSTPPKSNTCKHLPIPNTPTTLNRSSWKRSAHAHIVAGSSVISDTTHTGLHSSTTSTHGRQ